jgi:predicted NUDIX family NTP pyrophosphohydrolase
MGFFAVLLFVLAFSISVPTSYAANTTVKSITISKKKLKLKKGKTYKLKAKLSPKKAKGKISWKSSNKKVATVSKKGLVKAKKVGSATITAYVKGTKIKKTCKVTVTAASKPNTASAQTPTPTTEPAQTPATELPQTPATELPQTPTTEPTTELTPATEPVTEPETEVTEGVATATTQEELEQLLATEPKEIRIRTEEEGASFSVPAGNHQGTILSVDVPNGKVENTGYFQQIVIQSIGDHTYVEKAVGNHILYEAESGRIQIAEGAKADIEIASIKTEPSLDLENDGEITELLISNQALVVITGISTSRAIPVTAGQESYGSIINTSQNVKLMADAAIELILQEGAEESTAFIYDSSDTPTVVGLGCVTVTDYSKGEVRTVVAENNASEERTVTVTGKVADGATEQGLSGAVLSVFAYSRELEEEYLEQNTEEAEYTAVANEDGIYEIPNVPVGNYFMVIQQGGYISVTQTLIITSMEDETYSNGVILLSEIGEEACGSISGRLYDAENGKPIDYSAVLNVRKGWNNLSGSPISTFYIDSSDEGMYSFDDLPAGAYTIQVFSAPLSDAQIVADSFSVAVLGGMDHTRNFDVTQAIAEDQIRFVLQWGDEASNAPRDLDAHLVGPTLYGEQFHVWFSDRNYSENGSDIAAELDVDCDSWEGPETITIYQEVEGVYQYYVFDYENRFDEMSPYLSDTSEAVVRVYQGNMLRATFYVPEGETGNL